MEGQPRLDASRPSAARLWAFVLSVAGAFVAVLGALQPWVTIRGQITATRGVDHVFGTAILVAAGVVLVCTIAIRLAGSRRVPLAVLALVASITIVVAALLAWWLLPGRVQRDEQAQAVATARAIGLPPDVIDALGAQTIAVDLEAGIAIALAGGVIAVAGGVLTVRWAGRIAEDAPPAQDRSGAG